MSELKLRPPKNPGFSAAYKAVCCPLASQFRYRLWNAAGQGTAILPRRPTLKTEGSGTRKGSIETHSCDDGLLTYCDGLAFAGAAGMITHGNVQVDDADGRVKGKNRGLRIASDPGALIFRE